MLITHYRMVTDGNSTVGALFVDGMSECYTLEDEHRAVKVYGETRIPAGIYDVRPREFGGHWERYSKKWPDWHRGMLQIMDVPGFTDILYHIGNREKDTAGCVLVGRTSQIVAGDMAVLQSTLAYKPFYQKVVGAAYDRTLKTEIIDLEGGMLT